MKKFRVFFFLFFIIRMLYAQEAWIVPADSHWYRSVEELFINTGQVAPFEEKPVIAEYLKSKLKQFSGEDHEAEYKHKAKTILENITLPFEILSPLVETAFSVYMDSDSAKLPIIDSNDFNNLRDFTSMYELNEIPSMVKLGFLANYGGFSMLFQPEIRASLFSLAHQDSFTNLPVDLKYFDLNVPYRGIAAYFNAPIEIRAGRDKLHIGPGQWSSLTLTQTMPYYDYLKFRFFTDIFSLSAYLIRLDPTITTDESDYLDPMYDNPSLNPEVNAVQNGKSYVDRVKHLVLSRFTFNPFKWLRINLGQLNLVGGRPPEWHDINPLNIYHSNFDEGVYSVPVSLNGTIVPLKGVKIYFDLFQYEASIGDENNAAVNPGARAYQTGFTFLSNPYFKAGPGRFRLDGEFSLVDPWTYGKYYNLRKFTSRIRYVIPFEGRYWVDYPLGFYLGPDCVDINLALSYGIPGEWEGSFHWNKNGMGSVNLYGFGSGNDYTHAGESEAYPLTGAPTGLVQWTDTLSFSYYINLMKNLKLSARYTLQLITNRFHIEGNNQVIHTPGISIDWKIF